MDYATFSALQSLMEAPDQQHGSETLFNQFKILLEQVMHSKTCISLDWLSVNFLDSIGAIPEVSEKNEVRQITENITLKDFGTGNQFYKHNWQLLYKGEFLANVLCYTRNDKFIRKGVITIDFKNHLLYTGLLWPLYDEIVSTFSLVYKSVKRADIAIDGLNYVMAFLNLYVKQEKGKKVIEMKGRPKLNSKVLDRKLMEYQNFNIGGGRKYITMYNKSLDIVKTRKDYIQEYWKANGIIKELLPIEVLHKIINDEKIYLDGYENIYRFEMRIKSEMFLKMEGFRITWLQDKDKLMSIVKRLAENFFEFVWYTYGDISKCKPAPIMPYHLFNTSNIVLTEAKPVADLYKTKLSIHKNVRQLYVGTLGIDDYATTQMLIFDVVNFELQKWFCNKLPNWIQDYQFICTDEAERERITGFLINMETKFKDGTEGELL